MNQRPTPETDAKRGYFDIDTAVSAEFAERLERERDEYRQYWLDEQANKSRWIEVLSSKINEAREKLEDWRNAANGAENPCPDEKHCTCVPLLHKQLKDAREAFAIATDQLVQAQMENRKLSETLDRLQEWHGLTDAEMRLRCGEMTAQEIRTVRAVLNAVLNK